MNERVRRTVRRPGAESGPTARRSSASRHGATQAAWGGGGGALRVRSKDPAQLTSAERLREVAELLAMGFRRLQLSRETGLDDQADPLAPCDLPVNGHETKEVR